MGWLWFLIVPQRVIVLTLLSVCLVLIYGRVPLRDWEWVPPVVKALIPHVRARNAGSGCVCVGHCHFTAATNKRDKSQHLWKFCYHKFSSHVFIEIRFKRIKLNKFVIYFNYTLSIEPKEVMEGSYNWSFTCFRVMLLFSLIINAFQIGFIYPKSVLAYLNLSNFTVKFF